MKCVTHQIILKGKNASHTLDVKKLTHIHTQIYTLNRWNESISSSYVLLKMNQCVYLKVYYLLLGTTTSFH